MTLRELVEIHDGSGHHVTHETDDDATMMSARQADVEEHLMRHGHRAVVRGRWKLCAKYKWNYQVNERDNTSNQGQLSKYICSQLFIFHLYGVLFC